MIKLFFLSLGILSFSLISRAHQSNEGPVSLELSSANPILAGKSLLTFQLVNTKTNHLISETDLAVAHEKKLHVILYDPSLSQFQHVHPTFTSSANATWKTEVNFEVNGNYWVWAQGELSANNSEFSAPTRLTVTNGRAQFPAPNPADIRSGDDKGAVITLSKTILKAGKMAMLGMTFSHKDGTAPQLSPYLGAVAHVIATPFDGDSLIHVHPMMGSTPTTAMLHVIFPTIGFYRLWIQFLDGGDLRIVPLSVEVK